MFCVPNLVNVLRSTIASFAFTLLPKDWDTHNSIVCKASSWINEVCINQDQHYGTFLSEFCIFQVA